jgi:hypothetical protein
VARWQPPAPELDEDDEALPPEEPEDVPPEDEELEVEEWPPLEEPEELLEPLPEVPDELPPPSVKCPLLLPPGPPLEALEPLEDMLASPPASPPVVNSPPHAPTTDSRHSQHEEGAQRECFMGRQDIISWPMR